jgi:hypothetical protein
MDREMAIAETAATAAKMPAEEYRPKHSAPMQASME